MENLDWAGIGGLITGVAALFTVLWKFAENRREGIGALAEGYDKLTPHLNQRIDDLVKELAVKAKEFDKAVERLTKLEGIIDVWQSDSLSILGHLRETLGFFESAASNIESAITILENQTKRKDV